MPRVSVCISVYNGADTIRETIESAQAQTYRDFEVLVLDDGSTDDSAQIAEDLKCRVVRQENGGRGFALKRLVELADAEWVALLDADDLWEPNKLAVQSNLFDRSDLGLIHSNGWFHYPDGRVEDRIWSPGSEPIAFDHILPDNRIVASSAVFRRDLMLEVGNFHPDTWSACDWYGWLLLAPRTDFYCCPEQLVRYVIRPGSIANRGYRFQSGKHHMLKDLVLPHWSRIASSVPEPLRETLRQQLLHAQGVAASTVAKFLDEEGKRQEARLLHREALRLAPTVPRVWTRAAKSYFRGKP